MPLYDYLCASCGRTTEALQRFADPPPAACPHCGGALKKMPSAPAFQFKGKGWYATDYGGKSSGAEPPSNPSEGDGGTATVVPPSSGPAATAEGTAKKPAGGDKASSDD